MYNPAFSFYSSFRRPSSLPSGSLSGNRRRWRSLGAAVAMFACCCRAHAESPTPRFDRDVQPLLTKAGCNQGACHGAQHGKGGFKLSLRGFDPVSDYFEIAKASKGRRLSLMEPSASLILAKATMELPHKGGKRFAAGSPAYDAIVEWIEQGAPPPPSIDERLVEFSIEPVESIVKPGSRIQLRVRAVYADGRAEEVASKSSFDSLNSAIAEVNPQGEATAKSHGDTAIMARFLDKVAVSRVIVPFAHEPKLRGFARRNFIDDLLVATWKKLRLEPSGDAADSEFFRRLHLDVIGTLPTPENIRKFLADPSADKRRKAIDEVLDRAEYAEYWAQKWGDLLRVNRELIGEKGMWSFHQYLRASFRGNKAMDALAEEILTASGSPATNGAANFFQIGRQPTDWSENAAQVFLGVRMQCARCHHHPFENISQADYFGLAACFVRVGTKPGGEFGVYGRDNVVFVRDSGEIRHPRTGQVIPPQAPGSGLLEDAYDRRRALANWLKRRENPALARNIANRYWGYLMGRGLVDPIDDLRVTNPPSVPELLDALTKELIDSGYDVKALMRTILNSHAYQLSSQPGPASQLDPDNRFFIRYKAKRMTAEQLLDAINFACGVKEKFTQMPSNMRAISLPDTNVASRFLDAFGRPRREMSCECERVDTPNMTQALELMTGGFLNAKIADRNGIVAVWRKENAAAERMVEEIYLRTFSRLPSEREIAVASKMIQSAPQPFEAAEDLLWTAVNSREFQFCH